MTIEPEKLPKRVRTAPLVPIVLAVAAGIVIDRYTGRLDSWKWGSIALAAIALIIAGAWRWRWAWASALIVAYAALGGGWHHVRWSDLAADDLARDVSEEPRPAWVRGVLLEVSDPRPAAGPNDQGLTRAILDVAEVTDGQRWHRASGRIQLVITGDRSDLQSGETVEAAGSLARVAGPLNPGEFDYRNYLRAQGILLRLAIADSDGVWSVPNGPTRVWPRLLGRVRAWSHDRLVARLDPRVAPLAAALLLGRREGVDPDVNDAFARTGTTHLLAISGLHLQVLAAVLFLIFRSVGVSRRASYAGVALTTIAYALLVGLMPSVVRSVAMTVTICLASLIDRPHKPANLLAMAGLVTLALNPAHLFDVGGQLSFLAIAAIVWCVEPANDCVRFLFYKLKFRYQQPGSALDELERKLEPWWRALTRKRLGILFEGLIVSIVVWLVALPLVMLRFHVVSPIGVLLNIPLIPITSAALLASGIALGLSAVWAPLGTPAAWFCSWMLRLTEMLVRWGAGRSWGHGFIAGPSWVWVLGFYGLLSLAVAAGVCRWPIRRWAWTVLFAWIIFGVALSQLPSGPESLEADVLAVGHGLAVVVQDRDGRTILYDCGKMRDPSVGRRLIAPALWSRGVNRLDMVILSHADSDHYDGLSDLLDRFSIGVVRIPPGFGGPANPGATLLLQEVEARGIPVEPIVAGDDWISGGASFRIRHPAQGWLPSASDNARSVVLDIEFNGRRGLLTGDLEQEGLRVLVEQPSAPVDAFLAPHHGGRTANPAWLYDWAKPGLVVVSQRPPTAGARDALAPLEEKGIPLLRTWERGAIRLRWTTRGIDAVGFLDAVPR